MNEELTRIFKECYPKIAEYIMSNSGTSEEAREAYAEAWSRVLVQLRQGKEIGNYASYLFTVARNVYLRECAHKGKILSLDAMLPTPFDDDDHDDNSGAQHVPTMEEPEDAPAEQAENDTFSPPQASPDDDPLQNPANWGIVGECMAEMTTQRQTILRMSLVEGLNDKQIAERLGQSEGTVANAKSRAMDDIRARAAQLLHERGNSFIKKILERKKAEKEAKKRSN